MGANAGAFGPAATEESLVTIRDNPVDSLTVFNEGGFRRWSIPVSLPRRVSQERSAYIVDDLLVPLGNPYLSPMFLTGLAFLPNGEALVCAFHGDIWRVSGIDDDLQSVRWNRIATGLHQPLGMETIGDEICVIGRDQLTRLIDYNGDGEIDGYRCVTNRFPTSTGSYDYYTGLPVYLSRTLESDARHSFRLLVSSTGTRTARSRFNAQSPADGHADSFLPER